MLSANAKKIVIGYRKLFAIWINIARASSNAKNLPQPTATFFKSEDTRIVCRINFCQCK